MQEDSRTLDFRTGQKVKRQESSGDVSQLKRTPVTTVTRCQYPHGSEPEDRVSVDVTSRSS